MSVQNIRNIILIAILASGPIGCASLQVPFLEEQTPPAETDTAQESAAGPRVQHSDLQFSEFDLAAATQAGDLVIRQGDKLRIMIWGYPELDHAAEVQPNGHITLPLAGEVLAEGATVKQLRERITERLEPFTRSSSLLLRPGDILAMSAWQNVELYHKAVIEPAGTVTLPLVGSIEAAGRPVEDIRKEVQRRLQRHVRDAQVTLLPEYMNRRVLQDHHVSVLTLDLQKRKVALIGAVGIQGLQTINGSLRISDALAQAQLNEKIAALDSIVVIRNPQSKAPQYRQIRMGEYFSGVAPDQNIYLQHEDIVIVPKTTIAKVGDFVDMFFSRTMPVFTWWSSLHSASVAQESADTVELINESLRLDLLNITP